MKPLAPKASVSLFFSDDIKTFPAAVVSRRGPVLRVPGWAVPFFASAAETAIEYPSEGGRIRSAAEALSFDGRDVAFRIRGAPEIPENNLYHSVDYKGAFTASPVTPDKEAFFAALAERINSREKNGLAKKIRETVNNGSEDTELLGFLAEINSKLDEILSVLKPEEDIPGSFTLRGVSISGGGFLFYSGEAPACDKIFVKAVLEGSGFRVSFAALCAVSDFMGNIRRADFIDPDETVRDEIVRFIFAREREILKEARL